METIYSNESLTGYTDVANEDLQALHAAIEAEERSKRLKQWALGVQTARKAYSEAPTGELDARVRNAVEVLRDTNAELHTEGVTGMIAYLAVALRARTNPVKGMRVQYV